MTTNNLYSIKHWEIFFINYIRSAILLFALFPSVACFLHINTCNHNAYIHVTPPRCNNKYSSISTKATATSRNPLLILQDTSLGGGGVLEKKKKKEGMYQFGDISKSVFNALGSSVNKVTGKDEYKFGDLS